MKLIKLTCPKCGETFYHINYWHWVWKSPFHWLWWDRETKRIRDYRLTRCPHCWSKEYMKREI